MVKVGGRKERKERKEGRRRRGKVKQNEEGRALDKGGRERRKKGKVGGEKV